MSLHPMTEAARSRHLAQDTIIPPLRRGGIPLVDRDPAAGLAACDLFADLRPSAALAGQRGSCRRYPDRFRCGDESAWQRPRLPARFAPSPADKTANSVSPVCATGAATAIRPRTTVSVKSWLRWCCESCEGKTTIPSLAGIPRPPLPFEIGLVEGGDGSRLRRRCGEIAAPDASSVITVPPYSCNPQLVAGGEEVRVFGFCEQGSLSHEAPDRVVTHTIRLSASRQIENFLSGISFHWCLRAVGEH